MPAHKCFLSYHRADYEDAKSFTDNFSDAWSKLIDRGIDASMAGAIVGSDNHAYIKRSIRRTYVRDSTVTIVLLGPCTWSRKFVDWEIAASLDDGPDYHPSALLVLPLPYAPDAQVRARLADNVESGYALVRPYPRSTTELAEAIDAAFARRATHGDRISNERPLRTRNAYCQGTRTAKPGPASS